MIHRNKSSETYLTLIGFFLFALLPTNLPSFLNEILIIEIGVENHVDWRMYVGVSDEGCFEVHFAVNKFSSTNNKAT